MKRRVFVSSDEQEEPWRNYTSPKRPLTSAAWETLFVVTGGVLGGPAGNAKKRKVVVAPKPTGSVEPVGVVGAEDPMLKVVIQGLSGMDKSSSMGGFSARGNTDQDSVGKPVVDEVRTVAIHETDKEVDDARGSIRRWCDVWEESGQWEVSKACLWAALALVLCTGAGMLAVRSSGEEFHAARQSPWCVWGGAIRGESSVSVDRDHGRNSGIPCFCVRHQIRRRTAGNGCEARTLRHGWECQTFPNPGTVVSSAWKCPGP